MKKRIITLFIIFLTITSGVGFVSAQNETIERNILETSNEENEVNESKRIGEIVKASEDGYLNISFEDGYNGYCINKGWEGATKEDTFTVKNTSYAVNNNNGEDIGNYIKILFVDFHDDVSKNEKLAQNVIWSFSNDYYSHRYTDYVEKIIEIAKSGRVIADHGETITINDTTKATFDFEVLSSGLKGYQNFFAYKITYSDIINEIPSIDDIPLLGSTPDETPDNTTYNETTIFTTQQNNNTTDENESIVLTAINDNNSSNENKTSSDDDNQTVSAQENITSNNSIDLKNHVTGYSTIFAILVILILGCVLVYKIKRD